MATGSSKHRPAFHLAVLVTGFIIGGFLQQFLRRWLPVGAVKTFFSEGFVLPQVVLGPIDLIIFKFSFIFTLDVSLLALVGVLVAYLIARSLF